MFLLDIFKKQQISQITSLVMHLFNNKNMSKFLLASNVTNRKLNISILVSGLITFIAAVHYWYMRDYWATNAESPTFFRYVDWVLTVPLMCVEFYLI